MTETAHPRLIIDLDRCGRCESCSVRCSYHDRPHAGDHGMYLLLERATFAVVCRRCRHASCIEACPFDALERDGDCLVRRHNLRCVSCKSCAVACPFGTIYPELLTFYERQCDGCIGNDGQAPACVASCHRGR